MGKLSSLKRLSQSGFYYLNSLPKKESGEKQIDILLSDARMEPYYFAILFSFLENQYKVNLFVSLKWLAGAGQWIRILLVHPLLHLKLGNPKGKNRILADIENKGFSNSCFLNSNVFNNTSNDTFLPFPMHPEQYASGRFKMLEKWRIKSERPIQIMFSGNSIKDAYNNPVFSDYFKMPNRWEVLENIEKKMSNINKHFIEDENEWELALIGDYKNQLLVCRWEWSMSHQKNLNARIPNTKWLKILGNTNFFLACPGIVIPQSHNCIEAMAMGAIPVLSYSHLFHPNLEDGVNCLSYSTLDELTTKIEFALKMSEDSIEKMRENVLDYYLSNLSFNINIESLTDINIREVFFFNELPIKTFG